MNVLHQQLEDHRVTPDGQYIKGCSHTTKVLNHKHRNSIIIKAICDLRKITDEFDSIACCGISGLMVVPQIAELLNKHIIVIRKKNEKCYSDFFMEGVTPWRYIIIDDLICSGNTFRHITSTISNDYHKAKCVGLYCYMPQECSYNKDNLKEFERRFRTQLLNI